MYLAVTLLALVLSDIVLSCSSPCGEPPRSRFDLPACADYELDRSLIEALGRGEESAVALLRARYDAELSLLQRHRIAAALLGKVAGDSTFWTELYEHAALAVRFPMIDGNYTAEFIEYCNGQGVEPEQLWSVNIAALEHVSRDPRAESLMQKALDSPDPVVLSIALETIAERRRPGG